MPTDLYTVTPTGQLTLHFHPGQRRAWDSTRRVVAVIAGAQSGKSVFGPPWLHREIQRKGSGDYMVVTPTYPLLSKKALPEFLRYFGKQTLDLGDYNTQQKLFVFSPEGSQRTFGRHDGVTTQVYFGHAQDPESLESATAKAAWLDEAGQTKFRLGSWEAIKRRLAIHQGRVLITTTPYSLGWLKQQVYDRWKDGNQTYDVINFRSIDNPAFPRQEYDDARASLPGWRFRMFYDGLFERPAGLIYDCWDDQLHRCPRFAVPPAWPRYLGLDFGGIHTAGIFFAEEPGTGKLYAYREYLAGGRTAKEHVAALTAGELGLPVCCGGRKSEQQWRDEFAAAGLPVREPVVTDVEVGIGRVYGAIKRGELVVFSDLAGLLDELASYSRPLDDSGNPTEGIEDKESYHRLDATRYIVSWLKREDAGPFEPTSDPRSFGTLSKMPEVW